MSLSDRARSRAPYLFLSPLAAAILATPAFAQQQPGGPAGGLEEIIVTAEFRSSSVQDTPIAITAVNAEMLEARRAEFEALLASTRMAPAARVP